MKKLPGWLVLILCCLTIGFQACQFEITEDYIPVIYEGAAYLDNYETPPFLYQYEEKNSETEHNRGWIIDNEGNLRKYQDVHVRMFDTNNTASMRAFVERTELVKQIDVEDLVRQYKKNLQISRIAPSIEPTNSQSPMTSSYYGYALSYPDGNGTNCSSRRQVGYYARFMFESKGSTLVKNNNSAAKAVLNYLKETAKTETK